jgi:phosphate/sulfate permease
MFEVWIIQQIVISLIITVVLGGSLTAILWFALRKKLSPEDEMIPGQVRKRLN